MIERVLIGLAGLPFLAGAAVSTADPQQQVFTFEDPAIIESSGLVVDDGLFVTVNDSGDSARVFTVDPRTGDTVGVTTWSSEQPTDVEALAPAGPGRVWVGDTGGNVQPRETVTVARVPVGRGDRTVDATTYELHYPDGPHDAETLVTDPTTGRLYLATKSARGDQLYATPARLDPDAPNELTTLGEVLPIATDGAFFPDGRHLVVRGYISATVYEFPSLAEVDTIALPPQQQGEGIAVDADGRVFVSTEGLHTAVLRVTLPDDVRRVVTPPTTAPSPTTAPAVPSSTEESDPLPTRSREGRELPETTVIDRPEWPWFLSGVLAVGFLMVLMRSMRRR